MARNTAFFMHQRAVQVVQQQRGGGSPTLPRRTFIRLDGVSQHAVNDSGVATAIFPGGSPNGPAGTVTFVAWVRVETPDRSSYWLFSAAAGAEARGWYAGRGVLGPDPAIYDYRRREVAGTSLVNANTTYSASPWEGPGWRMTAHILRPDSVQQYLAGSIGSPVAYDPAVYVHPAGKWFVLGARIDGATGPALQVGTTWAGDIRAPAVYTAALTESQLQAIEAAGPTYDHAAAGAAGWWPGDGDTYPTIRNLGTEGSAWDLTLANGSQAMIMEE